jgi:peptidyl-tRNA hydrolase, PTH1 family
VSTAGWLVVGLGNPGPAYAKTRHNAGYLVVEELADRIGGSWRAHRSRRADVVEGRLAGEPVVLARPRSYMNDSGGPVAALVAYYKPPVERVVVAHDDLDLSFGVVRLKRGGGDGGHNGLKSIRQSLGSPEFARVRLGIGRPPGHQDPADFVLSPFSAAERARVPDIVDTAAAAIADILQDGIESSQNRLNRA